MSDRMRRGLNRYVNAWRGRGYPDDIPDEVPPGIAEECLAPSYKAICLALLRNDHSLQSLGLSSPRPEIYMTLKRIEFQRKAKEK